MCVTISVEEVAGSKHSSNT